MAQGAKRRRKARIWLGRVGSQRLLLIALAVAGAIAAAALFGQKAYPIGPFEVSLRWSPSTRGVSELIFPPLGRVSARTHAGPTRLEASLDSIDFQALADLVSADADDQEAAFQGIVAQAKKAVMSFAGRLIVCAGLGGAAAVAITRFPLERKRLVKRGAAAALGGAVVVSLMLGLAWLTYDPQAFRSPTFRGGFASVPWVIDAAQEALGQVAEVEARLRKIARNVYEMYQRIDELPPPFAIADADVTILHMTDFHNHPVAAEIARGIAEAFEVDLAVNTGDLTDFGTLLEAELLQGLKEFPVPHYLVTGNHETPDIVGALSLLDDVVILDGQLVEESGLRLLGLGDPKAASYSAKPITAAEAKQMADEINQALEQMTVRPDVLAVHNHRVGTGIRPGLVPLVLFGHSHTPGVNFREGTAYVNAGTTGGAGVRGLEPDEPVRISLAVIYIGLEETARVIAVDLIRLSPVAEGFTLERRIAPLP